MTIVFSALIPADTAPINATLLNWKFVNAHTARKLWANVQIALSNKSLKFALILFLKLYAVLLIQRLLRLLKSRLLLLVLYSFLLLSFSCVAL